MKREQPGIELEIDPAGVLGPQGENDLRITGVIGLAWRARLLVRVHLD